MCEYDRVRVELYTDATVMTTIRRYCMQRGVSKVSGIPLGASRFINLHTALNSIGGS